MLVELVPKAKAENRKALPSRNVRETVNAVVANVA